MFLKLSESKLPKFSYRLKNSSLDFPWKKQKNEIIEYLPECENSLYWQIIYDLEMKQKWNVKY